MASPALVSFLGFPGWAALHLQLPGKADPAAMAQRLLQARQAAQPDGTAAALLASFLRQQTDAWPLPRPWGVLPAGGRRGSHRYRIVCRGAWRPPQVMVWCWQGTAAGWRACGKAESLPLFLARHGADHQPRSATVACRQPLRREERVGRVARQDPSCELVGLELRS
jgi:hypothetical protein